MVVEITKQGYVKETNVNRSTNRNCVIIIIILLDIHTWIGFVKSKKKAEDSRSETWERGSLVQCCKVNFLTLFRSHSKLKVTKAKILKNTKKIYSIFDITKKKYYFHTKISIYWCVYRMCKSYNVQHPGPYLLKCSKFSSLNLRGLKVHTSRS